MLSLVCSNAWTGKFVYLFSCLRQIWNLSPGIQICYRGKFWFSQPGESASPPGVCSRKKLTSTESIFFIFPCRTLFLLFVSPVIFIGDAEILTLKLFKKYFIVLKFTSKFYYVDNLWYLSLCWMELLWFFIWIRSAVDAFLDSLVSTNILVLALCFEHLQWMLFLEK